MNDYRTCVLAIEFYSYLMNATANDDIVKRDVHLCDRELEIRCNVLGEVSWFCVNFGKLEATQNEVHRYSTFIRYISFFIYDFAVSAHSRPCKWENANG